MIRNPEAIEVRDEGAVQGRARVVDFVGAGVAATVSGQTATVTIAGGGAGSDPLYEPGSYTLATGTYRVAAKEQSFTGTQELVIEGTARLSLVN